MAAKNSAQLLLDEINRLNKNAFKPGSIFFSTPQAVDEPDSNTMVTVKAAPGSKLSGEQTIWYSRIDLTDAFEAAGVDRVVLNGTGRATTLDLIQELNATYELALDESDIEEDPLPDVSDGEQVVAIRTKPSSLAFTGDFDVILQDRGIELSSVIVNTVLNGFTVAR